MNILIVDDNYSKVEEIGNAVAALNIVGLQVEHVTTAQATRAIVREKKFELVLIDLHLPHVVGDRPTANGGLELFDMLCLDEKAHLPTDVLFITGKQELVEEARDKARSRGAELCFYSCDSDLWRQVIIGRVQYVAKRLASRRRNGELTAVDIVIVTALATPELHEVLKLDYAWKPVRVPGDPTGYHCGEFNNGQRIVTVAAACAQRKGMPSAATLAFKLSTLFRPKYLVMLGICAGIRAKSNLGDIVIADPTWDWGAGKRGILVDGSPVFLAAPYQMRLNPLVSELAKELAMDPKVIREIRAGWDGSVPEGSLTALVGPMASGASVIADDELAGIVNSQHKELLAIEMEAYAVMAAAEYSREPAPIAIAIKSVCDFADSKKDDRWQSYAAYTSAAFADRLFRSRNLPFDRTVSG